MWKSLYLRSHNEIGWKHIILEAYGTNADIELYAGLYSGHARNEQAARQAKGNASASMIGGIGDMVGGFLGSDK